MRIERKKWKVDSKLNKLKALKKGGEKKEQKIQRREEQRKKK